MGDVARRTGARRIVVVKGAGGSGLGDLFLSVLNALAYCRVTGRAIHVDWSDGRLGDAGENAFPRLFELTDNIEYLPNLPDLYSALDVVPRGWKGRLDRSLHDVYVEDGNSVWDRAATVERYSFDLAKVDYAEPVLVMWEFTQIDKVRGYLDPAIASLGTEDLLRWVRKTYIRMQSEIESEARRYLGNVVNNVGIHVRLTDEAVRQKGFVALKDYFRAIDRLKDADVAKTLVLATDNSRVEEAFRHRYDNVMTHSKWFPPAGEAIHLDSGCPDRWQSTRDALVEARMLSLCDHLITQRNSSFSRMARIFFDGDPGKLVTLEARQPWLMRVHCFARRLPSAKLLQRASKRA